MPTMDNNDDKPYVQPAAPAPLPITPAQAQAKLIAQQAALIGAQAGIIDAWGKAWAQREVAPADPAVRAELERAHEWINALSNHLQHVQAIFLRYAEGHDAKGLAGVSKARANREVADQIARLLAHESTPDA